jgi:heat shock protein HspQ
MKGLIKRIKVISLMTVIFLGFGLILIFSTTSYATIYSNISGVVIDLDTKQPVSDLWVICVPKDIKEGEKAPWYSGKTDKNGRYIIEMVPPGEYQIFIDPENEYLQIPKIKEITVIRGKNLVDILIFVKQCISISGRVFMEDGITPAKNVILTAIPENWEITLSESLSNEEGSYVLKKLEHNSKYTIYASLPGYASVYKELQTPNINEKIENVNFILGNASTTLSGKVVSNGTLVADAEIVATSLDCSGYTKTNSEGEFIIKGLKEGIYTVIIRKKGYETKIIKEVQVIEHIENKLELTILIRSTQGGRLDYKENLEDLFESKKVLTLSAFFDFPIDNSIQSVGTFADPCFPVFFGIQRYFEPDDPNATCSCYAFELINSEIIHVPAYPEPIPTSFCNCEWERECVFYSSGTLYFFLIKHEICLECCPPSSVHRQIIVATLYTKRIEDYWRTKQTLHEPGVVIRETPEACSCILDTSKISDPCKKYWTW